MVLSGLVIEIYLRNEILPRTGATGNYDPTLAKLPDEKVESYLWISVKQTPW